MHQRQTQLGDLTEIHDSGDILGTQVPEAIESLIAQPQAAVAAEHGDGVVELVQRRLLHLDQAIELRLELQFAGLVAEQDEQTTQGVRLANDAHGAAVRQGPHFVVGRMGQAIEVEFARFERRIIRRFGRAALLAQTIEPFAVRRPFG